MNAVVVYDWLSFVGNMKDLALVGVEIHEPVRLPFLQSIKVLLQLL